MNPKAKDFQEKFSDLNSWVSNTLAHSLAKKLTAKEVDSLMAEFRRIAREAKAAVADSNPK